MPQAYAIQERAAHPNLNAGPGGKGFQACAVTAFHGDVARTLTARHDSSPCADRGMDVVAIAFSSKDYGADAGEIAPTMRSMGHNGSHANGGGQLAVAVWAQVRRFTPTEAERLQGFPDGHTLIPWPVVRDIGIQQCRKRVVRATVRTPTGAYFVATNHLSVDPGVCPRAEYPTGEGYDLCASVCGQQAHAEIRALSLAGKKARGATLYIEGHTYACESCMRAADEAGIADVVVGPPPAESCPDGPRYKALGNSMAVPVMRWIGERIDKCLM